MPKETIRVSTVLSTTPSAIYEAWLDGKKHSAFTGGAAAVQPKVGGRHSAWDGYIHGWNLKLEPGKRIVQAWRSSDFAPQDPDSIVDVRLKKTKAGTEISIVHSDIPEGQGASYEQGWHEHYFQPMAAFFAKSGSAKKSAADKGAAKKTAKRVASRSSGRRC